MRAPDVPDGTYTEEELLPLSALQHLRFCPRQCALIHVEQLWADNPLTVEGTHLHRRADTAPDESRGDVRTVRALPLRSLALGLAGRADVVEFHRPAPGALPVATGGPYAASVPAAVRGWRPFPVEYKRGRPKRDGADELQLCAQALCLEEMLGAEVREGALFYGQTRHRLAVSFGKALRREVREAAAELHRLVRGGVTPRARREPKCERCSLVELCMPDVPSRSAAGYLRRALAAHHPDGGEPR